MIAAHHDTIEKYCLVWCGHEDCQCRRQTTAKHQAEFDRFVAEMGRTLAPLAAQQEPLGAEFAAVWAANVDQLYEN
jgi:hypothetical protein